MPWANEGVRKACTAALKFLPTVAVVAFLKAIANAWPTHYRYTGVHAVCPIGCSHPQGDDIRHLLQCPVLLPALSSLLHRHWPTWPMRGNLQEALCIDAEMTKSQMVAAVLCLDVAVSIVLARRHGDFSPIEGIVKARTRVLCRIHSRVQEFLDVVRTCV